MHPTKEHAKHHSISLHVLVSIVEFETSPKKVDQKRNKRKLHQQKKDNGPGSFPVDSKESDSDTGEASPSASPDVEASEAASPEAVPQVEVPPAPVEAAGGSRLLEGKGRPDIISPKKGDDSKEMTCLLQYFGEVKVYE